MGGIADELAEIGDEVGEVGEVDEVDEVDEITEVGDELADEIGPNLNAVSPSPSTLGHST